MKILLFRDLRAIIPLSRTTIWRMERDGRFPKRVRLGARCGWKEDEVLAWLASRPRGMTEASAPGLGE